MNTLSHLPPRAQMTASPGEIQALTRFVERMRLAKILTNQGLPNALDAFTLDQYRDAVHALPPVAFDNRTWMAFLSHFKSTVNEGGSVRPGVALERGPHLLAVLPTNLYGTVWTEEQIRRGEHFCLMGVDAATRSTTTGDRFPAILPPEVFAAGLIQAMEAPGNAVDQLQAVYQRLVSLLQIGGE
ncbi:hypothetical protein KBB08_02735 [Candidatus Gracilibacteria bacterium]|nr:hypothetical protein [Candidatus Gracilibacteria bacterium]